MQVTCNSDFLAMGAEMHYILLICVNRFPLDLRQSLSPLSRFPGSRAFLFFAWSGYLFKRLAIWPGTGPLARVNRDALLYSNKLQNTFLFYLLALQSSVV